MPFTAAHPAAVLPLLRLTRGRVAAVPAALVIGSMVPDLPYFVPLPLVRSDTHALSALWLDVVLGLVVYAVWRGLLAPAAVALAPRGLRERVPDLPRLRDDARSAGRWVAVVVSLAAGTLTHLGWDALTHAGRWGTEHVPALTRQYGPLLGVEWSQHLSSLAGLTLLALWVVRWWRRTPPVPRPRRPAVGPGGRALALLAVVVPAALAAAAASARALAPPDPALEYGAFLAVTAGGSVALAAAVLTAAVVRVATSDADRHR